MCNKQAWVCFPPSLPLPPPLARTQVPEHAGSHRCRNAARRRRQVVRQKHLVQEHRNQPADRRHVSGQVNHGKCAWRVDVLGGCWVCLFGAVFSRFVDPPTNRHREDTAVSYFSSSRKPCTVCYLAAGDRWTVCIAVVLLVLPGSCC